MPRYVAFLRGVSPLNAKNVDLIHAFEAAGFTNVRTVISSGNVAFDAPRKSAAALACQAEASMAETLGHRFYTVVRTTRSLQELVEADPFIDFDLPASAKRMVTFLGEPGKARPALPIERGDVYILAMYGRDVLSAYIPRAGGPSVLQLIESLFGSNVTTRTWETVRKCAIV